MKQSEHTREQNDERKTETTERDRQAAENVEERRGTGRTDGPPPKKTRPRDTDPEAGT